MHRDRKRCSLSVLDHEEFYAFCHALPKEAQLPGGGMRLEKEVNGRGDPNHAHLFFPAKWEDRLGQRVTDQAHYATCRYLFRCACGREKIGTARAIKQSAMFRTSSL